MTPAQGPSGPAEREVQGPSGPAERETQGPSGPAERGPPLGDLSGREADELLRPAAELAIEMARAGSRQQPPLDVPSQLRPLLGFAKLTNRALTTARRVVDEDPAFRARVAIAATVPHAETMIGQAGVLWLLRPEGWEAELGALVAEARAAASAKAGDVEERTAQRRLRRAEEARERAERTAGEARGAAEAARVELQEERRLRRAADDAADRLGRHAASLEEQLAAARRRSEVAATQRAEREDAEAGAAAALAAADADLRALRTEVADLRAALAQRVAEAGAAGPPRRAEPSAAEPDRRVLSEAVAAASAAAVALGAALGRAASALEPGGAAEEDEAPADSLQPRRPAGPSATRPRWARRQRPAGHRRPPPLPPGIHDDSAEAAEHLVGLPNVALLVDGYNATLSTWPGLPLPEQRLRLIDALAELAARTGARPEVVFDGADVTTDHSVTRTERSGVKVSFTAPDVEADDVLIARAADLPLPVVVASDDRRVREGASAAGANVLGVEQLLAALRRKG